MKRKVIGIALVALFTIGLFGTINTNQTNQKKNIQILEKSEAKTVNCSLTSDNFCDLWPTIGKGWYNIKQQQ